MASLKLSFLILVLAVLLYLVIDALYTGSVWVRGSRTGFVNFRELAHKRNRNNDPGYYWGFLGFYTAAFVWLLYLLTT